MTRPEGPIVVGVESTAAAVAGVEAAIELGAWEAGRHHVELHLVHGYGVLPSWIHDDADPNVFSRDHAQRTLDRIVCRAMAAHPGLAITGELAAGSAADGVVTASMTASAVVVCADTRVHYGGLQAGLVSVQVAAHAHAPVLVVPGPRNRSSATDRPTVVVGIDGSTAGADAIPFAFEEADARCAMLRAVFVWDRPTQHAARLLRDGLDPDGPQHAAERMLHEATAIWRHRYPDVPVTCEAVDSTNPVQALSEASVEADLVVVGTRGDGGFASLELGSVSDGLVRFARTTVAVIPNRA